MSRGPIRSDLIGIIAFAVIASVARGIVRLMRTVRPDAAEREELFSRRLEDMTTDDETPSAEIVNIEHFRQKRGAD